MSNQLLHILKFEPILKDKIWGGRKLHTILNKESESPNVGESWEISDVDGDCSVVNSGPYKGEDLKTLLSKYKDELVGKSNYNRFGDKFPLLIKFIDAKEDLSVQLHPNDELAKRKHNSLGKTEMWHIIQADPEANIIIGFNQAVDEKAYQKYVLNKNIKEILNYENVSEGDTFFVHSGLIHAIGKGVMLAEIQQTSDITYRIYDWDRVDTNGQERELHQKDALEAIDFKSDKSYKINYQSKKNEITDLVKCEHFTTNVIEIDKTMTLYHNEFDSFVIYICLKGEVVIRGKMNAHKINEGETILVPATLKEVFLETNNAKLLQVYL